MVRRKHLRQKLQKQFVGINWIYPTEWLTLFATGVNTCYRLDSLQQNSYSTTVCQRVTVAQSDQLFFGRRIKTSNQ